MHPLEMMTVTLSSMRTQHLQLVLRPPPRRCESRGQTLFLSFCLRQRAGSSAPGALGPGPREVGPLIRAAAQLQVWPHTLALTETVPALWMLLQMAQRMAERMPRDHLSECGSELTSQRVRRRAHYPVAEMSLIHTGKQSTRTTGTHRCEVTPSVPRRLHTMRNISLAVMQ